MFRGMQCTLCEQEIQEQQKIVQCPHCFSVFHEEHYMEWLNRENTCPICSEDITIVLQNAALARGEISPIDKIKQSNIEAYRSLILDELPEEEIIRMVNSENSIDYSINEKSKRWYILIMYNYGEDEILLLVLLFFSSILPIIFPIITCFDDFSDYIFIALSIALISIAIYLSIKLSKSMEKCSKNWIALEFQKNN